MKRRFSTYNDGMLYVYRATGAESDFGAVRNSNKNSLDKFLKLAFTEMSKRDEDMDFAQSQGRALSVKVKTRLHTGVTKQHLVTIADILYSIIYIDQDRTNSEMYLYLEEVRKI